MMNTSMVDTLVSYSYMKIAFEGEYSFRVSDTNSISAEIRQNRAELEKHFVIKEHLGYYELFRKELVTPLKGEE